MEQFFTINAGQLATIISFLVGGVAFAYTLRGDIRLLGIRLAAVEAEAVELRKVVVELARQEERLNSMDQRMLIQGKRIDTITEKVLNGG